MDQDARLLWRKVVSSGQVEPFVVGCLEGMNVDSKRRMFYMARFLYERELKTFDWDRWRRGWDEDDTNRIATKYLSNNAIIRLMNEGRTKTRRRQWIRGNVDPRIPEDLILEEAEYRGLKTNEQLRWEDIRDMTPGQRSTAINRKLASFECIERGHSFIYITGVHKCTNCKRSITDEEVMLRVNRECASRVWKPE